MKKIQSLLTFFAITALLSAFSIALASPGAVVTDDVPYSEYIQETETNAEESSTATLSATVKANGTCGANVNWTLDSVGTLTISGTGKMTDYTYSSRAPWYSSYRSSIAKVVINTGVTSVGSCAFEDCENLISITIPNSVTSIGSRAFYNCESLPSITLPNSVTNIGYRAFYNCKSIANITIPNSVTSIDGSAFDGCVSLTSITLPNNFESIGNYAFYNCNSLTSITIPDSVESIGKSAFSGCTGLTSVTIPNSVESIGDYAFCGCSSLTSVTIPSSVVSIGEDVFENCSKIKSVTMPGTFKASSVFYNYSSISSITISEGSTSIRYGAFSGCSRLTSITIPDSVTSIASNAFYNCTSLTSITIPGSVESIGNNAFSGCKNLKIYGYSGTAAETYANNNNISFVTMISIIASGTCGENLTWTLNDYNGLLTISGTGKMTDYSAINDMAPWYNYISNIKEVVIKDGATSIGDYAFRGCTGIKSVTIPGSVTSIGDYAFRGCTGFSSITIPNSVESIGDYAFSGCTGLTSITIPNSVTSIGGFAFFGCESLTSITIPNSVESIGDYAFSGCESLTSITIPNSVESIGDYAFSGCTGLTSITIPNNITSIGDNAFSGCGKLASITIPNSVESIGANAFSGCTGLTSVTIPNSVTSIAGSAFYGCSSLISITIPDSVTSIGDGSFEDCDNLTIYGYKGSYAETYANNNSIPFKAYAIKIDIGEKTDSANVRFVVQNGTSVKLDEADGNTQYTYTFSDGKNYDIVQIVEKTSADSPTAVKSQYYYIDVLNLTATKLELDVDTYMQIYDETSVRVGEPTGLRFKARISSLAKSETEDFEITEYGFIIAKKSDLGEKDLSFDSGLRRYVYAPAYVKANGTDVIFDSSNDEYDVFTGVLYNIPTKQYKTELACRTYTKIKIGENTLTLYGEIKYGDLYSAAQSALDVASDSTMKKALIDIISVADKTPMIDGAVCITKT